MTNADCTESRLHNEVTEESGRWSYPRTPFVQDVWPIMEADTSVPTITSIIVSVNKDIGDKFFRLG